MLEMADQEQGVPAPYPPPAPVQAGQQAQHTATAARSCCPQVQAPAAQQQ